MQDRQESSGLTTLTTGVVITVICLLITSAYAYTRYVHFGPIVESKIPLYVSNKAISWTSVLLICASLAVGPLAKLSGRFRGWLVYRQWCGLSGLWLATLHILVSMPIFNMFYYTGFFNLDGTLKVTTELSMLAGAVAWMLLLLPAVASLPNIAATLSTATWQRVQSLGVLALVITFGHVAWLGWAGWFLPGDWFGGMPPITLLNCGLIVVLVLLRVAVRLRGTVTDE